MGGHYHPIEAEQGTVQRRLAGEHIERSPAEVARGQLFKERMLVDKAPARGVAEGDVVVAISASGNSPNVVAAIEFANQRKAISVGLTGFDGGRLGELCEIHVHVPSARGEYGPVEDTIWCSTTW